MQARKNEKSGDFERFLRFFYSEFFRNSLDELCPNLLSIPGVGYTTAGLIAGEIRDINRFHSAERLISYSGIDVTVYESGKYKEKNCMPFPIDFSIIGSFFHNDEKEHELKNACVI